MANNSHTRKLIDEAQNACLRFDWRRLTPPDRLSSYFARLANRFFKKRGYTVQNRAYIQDIQAQLAHSVSFPKLIETAITILSNPERFDETYALLADDESRAVFDWFILYRVTSSYLYGYIDEIYPSPVSRTEFQKVKKKQAALAQETGFLEFNLALLALGQYCLPSRGASVQQGDVVLDVGGCSGDTAWMFRKQAGNDGKVHVFEPVSAQRFAIQTRCRESGWDNVDVLPYGLWNRQESAEITVAGGSSSLVDSCEGVPTETVLLMPLDAVVRERRWDRVDFIKMDIEGAEQNALVGCRETIERFAPRLAISIYHLADDMVRIPQLIDKMAVDYRYYLRHYSFNLSETVFYAVPE